MFNLFKPVVDCLSMPTPFAFIELDFFSLPIMLPGILTIIAYLWFLLERVSIRRRLWIFLYHKTSDRYSTVPLLVTTNDKEVLLLL